MDGRDYVRTLRVQNVRSSPAEPLRHSDTQNSSIGRLAYLRLPFSELWKGHQERTWAHSKAAHRLFMESEQGIQSRLSSGGLIENNIFLSGIVYLPTSSYLTAPMV